MNRWGDFLDADRDWRIVAHEPWKRRSMPLDAHFDDDFWFYFKSREEMARFRARHGGRMTLRRGEGVEADEVGALDATSLLATADEQL
ncbi:MAG: hypothetical protein ACR2G6_16895 [Gemmatimonadaceae bacterium]